MRNRFRAFVTAFTLAAACAAPAAAVTTPELSTSKSEVEVAFVLDTTGSMGGLIAAAKEKIWAIATTLSQADPAPRIRLALVGYRDRGDAYVTKVVDLTENLDSLYEQLMAFQASGGGDEPESVNQALHEAVTKLSWSEDADTYRAIFLVGDAPPKLDYQDDVHYRESVKRALGRGIFVNAIQCGSSASTTPIWKEIALSGEGRFFQVAQTGGAVMAATPYDDELARLSSAADATRMPWGSEVEQRGLAAQYSLSSRIAASAPIGALAGRSELNASEAAKSNWLGSRELVDDVTTGRADLSSINKDELPAELRELPLEERRRVVTEKAEKRKRLQSQIRELSRKRQEFLAAEARKHGAEKSLDHNLYDALREQGAKKGLVLEGGPRY